jgi:nitrogen fixation protein NifU and related proteins
MATVPSPPTPPARLEELYQSVILDHNRRPRNHREIEGADARAEGKNPNCGDRVIVWLRLEGDTVADVSFKVPPGEGCAISRASASIMTTAVKGKSIAEAEALFGRFIDLLTVQRAPSGKDESDLGPLEVFTGVSRFPHRVKCATMAWHALHAALRDATGAARGV